MDVVGEVVHHPAVNAVLVAVGHLAAGATDTGHGGAHAGAGTAEVPAVLIDLVEEVLGVIGGGADEHDVAGLAVEGHQAGTPFLPAVRQLTQHVGGVVVTCRRLHAQGMEFLGLGEGLANLGEARDDTAAVAVDTDRAAFPVTLAGLVGVLQLAQQAVGHTVDAFIRVIVTQTLDAGNETRPGAFFKLIKHGSGIGVLGHGSLLFIRLHHRLVLSTVFRAKSTAW